MEILFLISKYIVRIILIIFSSDHDDFQQLQMESFFLNLIYFKIKYLTTLLLNMARNYKTHN